MKYSIVKTQKTIKTPNGDVTLTAYKTTDASCNYECNCIVGATATVTSGRKIAKGTNVVIQRVMENKYATISRSVTGGLLNPAILVSLPDNTTVWTQGCNLTLNDVPNTVETFEAEDSTHAAEYVTSHYKSDSGIWYLDKDNKPVHQTMSMGDYGLSVYENYIKDMGDRIALIADDWRSDTYSFLVFTKEPKANNLLECVDKGIDKRFTDMWDASGTGLSQALEAYKKYVA